MSEKMTDTMMRKTQETGGDDTQQLTVYGTNICIDCRNLKAILRARGISVNYVDITENTGNMRSFFAIRDHAPECEEVRNMEGGAIGIPLFVAADGKVTLDVDEAFAWIGQEPVRDEEIVERREACEGCS